ncbi:hypothetical protein JB92DRAFT_3142882 [Gautieria morchelliformis]|nr:hypothetical protein JB92DRAFT_3142882 [Gautieria morchelliformis]
MQSEPLVVPLVLNAHCLRPTIEQACTAASPTKLISWGLHEGDIASVLEAGVAMACEDGSVYLFCIDTATNLINPVPPILSPGSHTALFPLASHVSRDISPSPPPTIDFVARSRNTSQSNHVPHPLSQPTRSRITSFVSKASAEAPKNTVDYDNEKDKLEGMLKGGPSVRDKSIVDGLRVSNAVAGLGLHSEADGGSQRKNLRLSYPGSTPPTPTSRTPRDSLSSPSTPSSVSSPNLLATSAGQPFHVGVAPPLTLKSHVLPPNIGRENRAISLKRLSSGILLVLQESGMVTVISARSGFSLASVDLESTPHLHPPPSPSPSTFAATTADHSIWTWKHLHVSETPECTILLVAASDQASATSEGDVARTRVAILQLENPSPLLSSLDPSATTRDGVLHKVAEWLMEGASEGIGLLKDDDTLSTKLSYVTPPPASTLVIHDLQVVPPAYVVAAPVSLQPSPDALSSSSVNHAVAAVSLPNRLLPIPNPFKPKIQSDSSSPSSQRMPATVPGRVVLGPAMSFGQVPTLRSDTGQQGIQVWIMDGGCLRGILWGHSDFLVFETTASDTVARVLGEASHRGLTTVERVGSDMFVLAQARQMDIYRLVGAQQSEPSSLRNQRLEHMSSTAFTKPCSVATAIGTSLALSSRVRTDPTGLERLYLTYTPVIPVSKIRKGNRAREDKQRIKIAWSYSSKKRPTKEEGTIRRLTSVLPVEVDLIVLGFGDGTLGRSTLTNLLTGGWFPSDEKAIGVNGAITSLHSITNERSGEKLVIAGVDDGGISVWDLSTLTLRAQWTIFTVPLSTVISLEEEGVGRLRGCILCISEDGTLAVVAVDGLECLYLIPGSAARLIRICLGEDNLLLVYADGKARLWDVKTQEFWRAMTSKTVDELLSQGGWFEADVGHSKPSFRDTPLAPLKICFSSYDAASTLLLDIQNLSDLIHPIPPSQHFRDPRLPENTSTRTMDAKVDVSLPAKRTPHRLELLKSFAAALLSFGIDDLIDFICKEKLGVLPSIASVGISGTDLAATLLNPATPRAIWQISPEHTASRLLALVTVLRGFLAFDGTINAPLSRYSGLIFVEECEQYANQVITFYVAVLPDAVGSSWQAPSLSFLARYWLHTASDLRLAARALFGATANRLSDEDTIALVEFWQHELPCLQPDTEKQSSYSALALLIAGNVATERYAVLSTSTLTDIAKSIALYLHDEACPHRVLAIDLCSRGFDIWQHHVDAMEVLRALFSLSTSAEKERNVGPQARLSVLQIASSNTPLFMTTLSLDILHPRSVQQRKSIMQLVAFLIRKKPLVLHLNLPKLVEAVVKSLDPGSSGDREAVFDAATEILGQVVKTFPSVDFHMPSQRLCVGTSEGAVIMYDLKTATRLYVLEGHRKRLVGCSFSPDGRRLATVCLEEGIVRVWKVGSSLTSLFMPGAPPRQGHSGSDPFKTLNFNVGDEANMTVAATLEWVRFEWPDDRTARLKIRDNAFTFNT